MAILSIDPEFQKHIPPLRPEEYSGLEQNIIKEGCRDPIVVWNNVILDGHNRYEICKENHIPFDTIDYVFDSREDVFYWIEENQMFRRNLLPEQFKLYLGRRYNRLKKAHGGERASTQNGNLKTSEILAESHGVSRNTVIRAGEAAAAIDNQGTPELQAEAELGNVSVVAAADVATLPADEQQEIVARGAKEILQKAKEIRAANTHVGKNTGNNEWYTPAEFIESARVVMGGIDLDPASSDKAQETVRAKEYFTEAEDGLNYEWFGRVWMNPPYSAKLIPLFMQQIRIAFMHGDISQAVILVNNATETAWFQEVAEVSSAICFPARRIKFIDQDGKPSGAPLQGQAFIYLGECGEKFAIEFSTYGLVVWGNRG